MSEDMHKRLVLALVYSYLWVAASDGQVSDKEINCFQEALDQAGYGGMVAPISEQELQNMFADVKDHFSRDFEDAVDKAKSIFEAFKGTNSVDQIIKVSRKAVVADEKLEDREEVVLKQIADFFGVSNP